MAKGLVLAWLAAFPVILFANADLVLPYLMATVYMGMVVFGWAIAASMTGGFASAAILVAIVCVVSAVYTSVIERRYREETHGTNLGKMGRRAKSESLSTYCPSWMNLAAGAVAGALLGMGPALFAVLQAASSPPGRMVGPGVAAAIQMGSSPTANTILVAFGALVGLVAAVLRRTSGFAKQMVWPLKNTYVRRRPDNTGYDKFLIYWWPVLGFIAIAIASSDVMGVLMSFIFVWAFSGVMFRQMWAAMHLGLLKLMGASNDRRLDYEYLLRVRLENEPDLHSCTYSGIRVGADGAVEVRGRFKSPDSELKARGLVESLVRGSRGKVQLVNEA